MRGIVAALACAHRFVTASHATAQTRIERNVVYGMYSGLALLTDVHHPEKPKRRARRQFTEEFKASAVRLVLDEGKTVGAAARGAQ